MDNLYATLEKRYGLPEGALSAVASVESGGKDEAVSPKGARGRFQFMPDTASAYGVDVADPISSAHGAAQYLSDLQKQYGSFKAAIAHYNGGTKAGKAVSMGNEPPAEETKGYLQKVSMKLPTIDPAQVEPIGSVQVSGYEPINPAEVEVVEPINPKEVTKAIPEKLKGLSNADLFLKGIKASGETTATGIGQVLDPFSKQLEKAFPEFSKAASEKLGLPSAEKVAAEREAQILAQRQANQDLLSTTPGMLGNVTGELGQALLLPGGTIGKAALAGGTMGAVQPTLPEENKAFNIGMGAAFGGAGQSVVNAVGRIAQPITKNLSDIGQKSVQILKDAGVPLDAAQATGSKVMQFAKRITSDNPFTGAENQAFSHVQNNAYTKAISKTMGEDVEHITPEVIQNAKTRLGENYDQLFERNGVRVSRNFSNELSNLKNEAERILPKGEHAVTNIVNDIIDKSKANMGHLEGKQYQAFKRQLDALEKQGGLSAHYAGELKDKLLEGLSSTVQKFGKEGDIALLKTTNKQYGNMKKIEDIALKDAEEGHVSPSLLYNSLTTKNKRNAFYQDDPELAKLAQAGKAILPEKGPNSGTAKRLAAQAAIPTTLAAYDYAKEGDIGRALGVGASAYLAPKALQTALHNPTFARYLEQGVGGTALRNFLQAPSKIGAGKIPLASFESYLQQVQKEKGTK
jgi:hypothetical protein